VLETPAYVWVSVSLRVRTRATADRARVAREVASALYRFLHPTTGGPDGKGWPFGRELFGGELYPLLQQFSDVALIEQLVLHEVHPATGQRGAPTTHLTIGPDTLLCSAEHLVEVLPLQGR
jgi:hypothetical protein